MGEPVSILPLASQVIAGAGDTVRDEDNPDVDISSDISGLRPGEKMEEELTLSQEVIGTRHQKIFCARETVLSELEIAALLRGLRQAVAAGDETAARQVVTRWVEGYTQPPADRKTS